MTRYRRAPVGSLLLAMAASAAAAETQVVYRSDPPSSPYYRMAEQFAGAVDKDSGGKLSITIEANASPVERVEAATSTAGGYIFSAPSELVKHARAGEGAFAPKNPAYAKLRSLFVIPSATVHFVMRESSGVESFAELAGKTLKVVRVDERDGRDWDTREVDIILDKLGLAQSVVLDEVARGDIADSIAHGDADGFVIVSPFPAEAARQAAANAKLRILSMTNDQLNATGRRMIVIPAHTYAGVDYDVLTTSIPMGVFTDDAMDTATAYELTKAYWLRRNEIGRENPQWLGISNAMINTLTAPLHPGALQFYREYGFPVGDHIIE